MDNIKKILKDKNVRYALMIIGAVVIIFCIYKYFVKSYATFRMFYADWCPQCKKAKPEFQRLMEDGEFIEINGKRIKLEMINGDDPQNQDLLEKFDVGGFPTFIYSSCNGRHTPFKGDPKESLFRQFLVDKLI